MKVQRTLPSKLSNVISSEENWLWAFKTKSRKQTMTDQEAAEAEECDMSCAQWWRKIEAAIFLNNNDVVFLDSQLSQLKQFKVLQPASVSSVYLFFFFFCWFVISVISFTMLKKSEPSLTAVTWFFECVLRLTAKKADTEVTATAKKTDTEVTATVTARWKNRRLRIQKSRKQKVSQLLDMFSQPMQDIITVTIHSSQ